MALAKLGNVFFSVNEEETFTRKNQITDHPVEDNSSISDNVISRPDEIRIRGIIVNEGSDEKKETLKDYMKNVDVLSYIGIDTFENVVMESMVTNRNNQIANGFNYDIRLKVIRRVNSQIVEIDVRKPVSVINNRQPFGKLVELADNVLVPVAGALLGIKNFGQVLQNVGKVATAVKEATEERQQTVIGKIQTFFNYARNTFGGGTNG